MTDTSLLTGHCLCGAIRFTAKGPPLWIAHCHCDSCRRATASPMTTFFAVPNTGLTWHGRPASYASSKGVTRGFCATCGSPVFYRYEDKLDETHLYAALLEDPSRIKPERHDFLGERLAWFHPIPDPQP